MQPWLSIWHLFVDKLRVHFGLSDPVKDATNLINNLRMKPGDKIATYNVEFMQYAAQLNWGDSVLCHRFYQGLPNRLQDPISDPGNRANPILSRPCINWQSLSTIIIGNKITNKIVSRTRRRTQQIAITKNKGKWFSTLPPHKTLFHLAPNHPQLCHRPHPLRAP